MEHLLEKIKKIEALIAGTSYAGEKQAAILAKERLLKKFPGLDAHRDAVEYRLSTSDTWHKRLLLALCSKYGVKPYRYHRQKYTTVMVRINIDFLDNVLWKEYLEYSKHLEELIEGIMENVIGKIHEHEDETIIRGNLNS
jgi:hypothetical protein